ncbi:uncharacterized protein RCC_00280 [Ramularia collo-cygni]|uniref:Uncharacterized protein n=1 Tax=Ramularia collo-cygni TaxID=112498 RepID=A0A2D3V252_9PEZI|nr:uncharacterized protein RCC_00280 [Ramularia collo-cygni]CZT14303.1 uncharacterized protein RCC_00280 [Ramularia collo-cygni]
MPELTWVAEVPTNSSSLFVTARGVGRTKDEHKKVRKHAAQMSAAKRLATIKQKERDVIMELVRQQSSTALERPKAKRHATEEGPPPWFISRLLAESSWYETAVQMNSLGQKSTRNILHGALTHNTSLWQCAVMAAGTHTNTCGLPPSALHSMGTGLIHLRSASLQAVNSAIQASVRDSLTCVAVALMAGWERGCRYGENSAYEMHMAAWRRMKFPPNALEEQNIDTLMDAVMELFKENLDEISIVRTTASSSRPQYPAHLPIGFRVFSLARPETRSLLDIVSRIAENDPTVLGSLWGIREFCVQAIAWGASHSVSIGLEVCPAHEEGWDYPELQALYHIRATCISLNAVLHTVAMDTHKVHWSMDHADALAAHVSSCRHLNTGALMGTKYEAIGLWSRFMMCAISRDPDRDHLLYRWMRLCGVEAWLDLEALLARHIDLHQFLGSRTHDLFRIVTGRAGDLKLHGWE